MSGHSWSSQASANPSYRDILLSHASEDKEFVRRLAADIESESFDGRGLLTWVDEAEIRAGSSVPGMINWGLEHSRFIGIVMTPAYFHSESGWTDAEWHAALHLDPDNREGRIIPLVGADCPYIPVLLRHLMRIDLRGPRYAQGLQDLLRILRGEPRLRPRAWRGQLASATGQIDRSTLVAERAVPEAAPDPMPEKLYSNLLPAIQVPRYVYSAPVSAGLLRKRREGPPSLPSKEELKAATRSAQEQARTEKPFVPTFRLVRGEVISFYDLRATEGPFAPVIEAEQVRIVDTTGLLADADDRRVVVSLLNMAVSRHAHRLGLAEDDARPGRFHFPPADGSLRALTWTPRAKSVTRTVAKPCVRNGAVVFWRHLGAYLKTILLADRFYLQIIPTWVLTEDGFRLKTGPRVGPLVIKWTGAERNIHLLYHVRFWTHVLSGGRPTIQMRTGDQVFELATRPAFVQQSCGIRHDSRDLLDALDHEASAIAEQEEQLADLAAEEDVIGALELTEAESGDEPARETEFDELG